MTTESGVAMKIILGADHGGFELKGRILAALKESGFEVEDVGTFGPESCDYPAWP